MLFAQYLVNVFRFAFREFAIRTDLAFGLVSMAAALLVGPDPIAMAELTTYDIGIYVACALAIYVCLRLLIFGPYHVWREARSEIADLQHLSDAPKRSERGKFAELRAEARMELIESVRAAHMCATEDDASMIDYHLKRVAEIEPRAVSDGSLHDDIRSFMKVMREGSESKKKDFSSMQQATEKLTRAIHGL